MNDRVLLVDDEQNLLDSLKRQLRKRFRIETALGPQEGLAAIMEKEAFAVVMSDLRMPGMDGIQFLSRVREFRPDTVRIILTGNADVESAIEAVNEGNVFRFLRKPCETETLAGVLQQGVEQFRLVTAEKELLEKTLKGCIKMLTDLLSMVSPEAFGRSARIKRYARDVAAQLDLKDPWKIETAAMLSQIGCVALPDQILKKVHQKRGLSEDELGIFASHPEIASELLSHIPRMEAVAEAIRYQSRNYHGAGLPAGEDAGGDLPLEARILKVVLDFDELESRGVLKGKALKTLRAQNGAYDPVVLDALERSLGMEARYVVRALALRELKAHMILADDVTTLKGRLLVTRGQEVGPLLIERLKNFAVNSEIKEPIRVLVPWQIEAQERIGHES